MRKYIAIATMVLLAAGLVVGRNTITIKGSDTLVRLGQRWAEEYMKNNPEAVIQVSGGGSGTGIAALLNGTTDVCEASRDMKEREYKLAERKGIEPYRISVAVDGIAVFLHKDNPLSDLTLAQLKAIYTGSVRNWKEVGGSDAEIILYSRENNSGTYVFFKKRVMDGEDFVAHTQTLPGTSAVVHAVAKDKNGIGYGGLAWATDVKFAGVKENDTTEAVQPNSETVSAGHYPISRDLYWFFNGKPEGELRALANWVLSEEGQKLAEEIGYVPLSRTKAQEFVIQ
jgi:phosphate transport system substrate-binding protein